MHQTLPRSGYSPDRRSYPPFPPRSGVVPHTSSESSIRAKPSASISAACTCGTARVDLSRRFRIAILLLVTSTPTTQSVSRRLFPLRCHWGSCRSRSFYISKGSTVSFPMLHWWDPQCENTPHVPILSRRLLPAFPSARSPSNSVTIYL